MGVERITDFVFLQMANQTRRRKSPNIYTDADEPLTHDEIALL